MAHGLSSLEKRRLRGNLTIFCSFLRRGSAEEGASLCYLGTNDRTHGNGKKLNRGGLEWFRMDIRKNFLTVRVIRH